MGMSKIEKALRKEHKRVGLYLGYFEEKVMTRRQRRRSLAIAWYEAELTFQAQKRRKGKALGESDGTIDDG